MIITLPLGVAAGSLLVPILFTLSFAYWLYNWWLSRSNKSSIANGLKNETGPTAAAYPAVVPLPDFNWAETEPVQLRPYKPKYHLTMAITNISISQLLEMDNTYLARIRRRREVMDKYPSTVLGANECVKPAVDELYTWLIGTYLPTRFPRMFQIDSAQSPAVLINLVTNERLPISPPTAPLDALRILGSHIDEDFLFLLPSADGSNTYTLQGFVTCFPNGFDASKKMSMKLADIHGPVPGYKEKLEKSMDRFFAKLEVGQIVARANWGINLSDELFSAFNDQHAYEGDNSEVESVDISRAYVRTERQTLHRLPQSRALVFSYKTYLYPLAQLKAEESMKAMPSEADAGTTLDGEQNAISIRWEETSTAEQLAQAIEGLTKGNVPGIAFYKRQPMWGPDIVRYLRE